MGERGDGCYRLERGLLKVLMTSPDGEEQILAFLGPGSIAGELALIDGQPRSASIFAVTDCELNFVSHATFVECTERDPEIFRYLVGVLAARLRETDEVFAASSFLNVKDRTARALLELSGLFGDDRGGDHIVIRHKLTQKDLAAMAGTGRENASRALREWKRRRIVTLVSGCYNLHVAALTNSMRS
jgi:CRP-like cAMP-binding protein